MYGFTFSSMPKELAWGPRGFYTAKGGIAKTLNDDRVKLRDTLKATEDRLYKASKDARVAEKVADAAYDVAVDVSADKDIAEAGQLENLNDVKAEAATMKTDATDQHTGDTERCEKAEDRTITAIDAQVALDSTYLNNADAFIQSIGDKIRGSTLGNSGDVNDLSLLSMGERIQLHSLATDLDRRAESGLVDDPEDERRYISSGRFDLREDDMEKIDQALSIMQKQVQANRIKVNTEAGADKNAAAKTGIACMRLAESFHTTAVAFANRIMETAGKAHDKAVDAATEAQLQENTAKTKWGATTTARKLAEKMEIEEGKEAKKTYTELVGVADKAFYGQESAFTKGKTAANKYLTEELASLTKIEQTIKDSLPGSAAGKTLLVELAQRLAAQRLGQLQHKYAERNYVTGQMSAKLDVKTQLLAFVDAILKNLAQDEKESSANFEAKKLAQIKESKDLQADVEREMDHKRKAANGLQKARASELENAITVFGAKEAEAKRTAATASVAARTLQRKNDDKKREDPLIETAYGNAVELHTKSWTTDKGIVDSKKAQADTYLEDERTTVQRIGGMLESLGKGFTFNPDTVMNEVAPATSVSQYKVVTSGTCESNGFKRIMDKDMCKDAAADAGFAVNWGPHGGYDDLVDGCSYRSNKSLFLNNKVGTCTSNKCDCSREKCLCEATSTSLLLQTGNTRAFRGMLGVHKVSTTEFSALKELLTMAKWKSTDKDSNVKAGATGLSDTQLVSVKEVLDVVISNIDGEKVNVSRNHEEDMKTINKERSDADDKSEEFRDAALKKLNDAISVATAAKKTADGEATTARAARDDAIEAKNAADLANKYAISWADTVEKDTALVYAAQKKQIIAYATKIKTEAKAEAKLDNDIISKEKKDMAEVRRLINLISWQKQTDTSLLLESRETVGAEPTAYDRDEYITTKKQTAGVRAKVVAMLDTLLVQIGAEMTAVEKEKDTDNTNNDNEYAARKKEASTEGKADVKWLEDYATATKKKFDQAEIDLQQATRQHLKASATYQVENDDMITAKTNEASNELDYVKNFEKTETAARALKDEQMEMLNNRNARSKFYLKTHVEALDSVDQMLSRVDLRSTQVAPVPAAHLAAFGQRQDDINKLRSFEHRYATQTSRVATYKNDQVEYKDAKRQASTAHDLTAGAGTRLDYDYTDTNLMASDVTKMSDQSNDLYSAAGDALLQVADGDEGEDEQGAPPAPAKSSSTTSIGQYVSALAQAAVKEGDKVDEEYTDEVNAITKSQNGLVGIAAQERDRLFEIDDKRSSDEQDQRDSAFKVLETMSKNKDLKTKAYVAAKKDSSDALKTMQKEVPLRKQQYEDDVSAALKKYEQTKTSIARNAKESVAYLAKEKKDIADAVELVMKLGEHQSCIPGDDCVNANNCHDEAWCNTKADAPAGHRNKFFESCHDTATRTGANIPRKGIFFCDYGTESPTQQTQGVVVPSALVEMALRLTTTRAQRMGRSRRSKYASDEYKAQTTSEFKDTQKDFGDNFEVRKGSNYGKVKKTILGVLKMTEERLIKELGAMKLKHEADFTTLTTDKKNTEDAAELKCSTKEGELKENTLVAFSKKEKHSSAQDRHFRGKLNLAKLDHEKKFSKHSSNEKAKAASATFESSRNQTAYQNAQTEYNTDMTLFAKEETFALDMINKELDILEQIRTILNAVESGLVADAVESVAINRCEVETEDADKARKATNANMARCGAAAASPALVESKSSVGLRGKEKYLHVFVRSEGYFDRGKTARMGAEYMCYHVSDSPVKKELREYFTTTPVKGSIWPKFACADGSTAIVGENNNGRGITKYGWGKARVRGWHVAELALDGAGGVKVASDATFDMFNSAIRSHRSRVYSGRGFSKVDSQGTLMAKYMESIPKSHVVLAAIADDGGVWSIKWGGGKAFWEDPNSNAFKVPAFVALSKLGIPITEFGLKQIGHKGSAAIIGTEGPPQKTWETKQFNQARKGPSMVAAVIPFSELSEDTPECENYKKYMALEITSLASLDRCLDTKASSLPDAVPETGKLRSLADELEPVQADGQGAGSGGVALLQTKSTAEVIAQVNALARKYIGATKLNDVKDTQSKQAVVVVEKIATKVQADKSRVEKAVAKDRAASLATRGEARSLSDGALTKKRDFQAGEVAKSKAALAVATTTMITETQMQKKLMELKMFWEGSYAGAVFKERIEGKRARNERARTFDTAKDLFEKNEEEIDRALKEDTNYVEKEQKAIEELTEVVGDLDLGTTK